MYLREGAGAETLCGWRREDGVCCTGIHFTCAFPLQHLGGIGDGACSHKAGLRVCKTGCEADKTPCLQASEAPACCCSTHACSECTSPLGFMQRCLVQHADMHTLHGPSCQRPACHSLPAVQTIMLSGHRGHACPPGSPRQRRGLPAVSIMSSTSTATLPSTSPMRFITSLTLCALRRLSTMARGASFSFFAKARALATPPTSGDTTTRSPAAGHACHSPAGAALRGRQVPGGGLRRPGALQRWGSRCRVCHSRRNHKIPCSQSPPCGRRPCECWPHHRAVVRGGGDLQLPGAASSRARPWQATSSMHARRYVSLYSARPSRQHLWRCVLRPGSPG